jgi:3-methyladenine DNA glycosylase AlkD
MDRSRLQADADLLDRELREAGTPERADQEKRYLKSELRHYGSTMPTINRVMRAFAKERPDLDRAALEGLAGELWGRGVHELRAAAVELLTLRASLLEEGDLPWIERLLRDARTWALIDPLAVEVVGPILRRSADGGRTRLERWAGDDDMWVRRTALLSFLLPLRAGDREAFVRFAVLADPMLEEKDFFIRKAIGWSLREYGKRRPDDVHAWLLPRIGRVAGLTLREAGKHLPTECHAELLAAYRARA